MSLRDDDGHGRDLDIGQARHWGAEVVQLAKTGNERRDPDGQLGLAVRPALVRTFGLQVDRNGLATSLVHGNIVPALDFGTRQGLELGVSGGDLGVGLEDKGVIDDAFGEGNLSRAESEVGGVDGGVLTTEMGNI